MANKNFVKTIIFSLAWATFLYLLFTNWDTLKSVQWQDLREIIKVSDIVDIIQWNAGYFLLFSLITGYLFICIRRNRKAQSRVTPSASEDWQDHEDFKRAVDRDCDPAYSSVGGNIHHKSAFDKDWEWKNLEP